MFFAATQGGAAPSHQLQCVYGNLNKQYFQQFLSDLRKEQQTGGVEGSPPSDRTAARIIDSCARQYGWTTADKDIAKKFVGFHGLELIVRGALEQKGLNTNLLDRAYKAEPLSRDEMLQSFEDEGYRQEFSDRIAQTGFPMAKPENAKLALFYIYARMMAERSGEDFEYSDLVAQTSNKPLPSAPDSGN